MRVRPRGGITFDTHLVMGAISGLLRTAIGRLVPRRRRRHANHGAGASRRLSALQG